MGNISSAGLPLVASNSRLFLFLLQNRDEQLLPWLNLSGIRDVVAVHGAVNHDSHVFPVIVDSGADVPKRFILINHNNLFGVFRSAINAFKPEAMPRETTSRMITARLIRPHL